MKHHPTLFCKTTLDQVLQGGQTSPITQKTKTKQKQREVYKTLQMTRILGLKFTQTSMSLILMCMCDQTLFNRLSKMTQEQKKCFRMFNRNQTL